MPVDFIFRRSFNFSWINFIGLYLCVKHENRKSRSDFLFSAIKLDLKQATALINWSNTGYFATLLVNALVFLG